MPSTDDLREYNYEHDNGGEHKDRLPAVTSGGASSKTTPANVDEDSAGSGVSGCSSSTTSLHKHQDPSDPRRKFRHLFDKFQELTKWTHR